jgi:hypothetical protein
VADSHSAAYDGHSPGRTAFDNEMLGKLRETQKGNTANATIGDLTRLSRNYQYVHTECGLIRTALNGLASELEAPKKKLRDAPPSESATRDVTQPPAAPKGGTTTVIARSHPS